MARLTRGEAIRAKCLECSCGSYSEVRLCPVTKCALYRYRLGREDYGTCKDRVENGKDKNQHDAAGFSAQKRNEEVNSIGAAGN